MEALPAQRLTYPDLPTQRLLLRKIRRTDREDLYNYGRQPELTRYLLWNPYRSLDEVDNFISANLSHYQLGEPASWGIEELESASLVGTVSFVNHDLKHNRVELGYALSPLHWGKGLMPEAIRAVLRYSFRSLNLHRIEAKVITENRNSTQVLLKCGMQLEGTCRDLLLNRGIYHDVDIFAMLAHDFIDQE